MLLVLLTVVRFPNQVDEFSRMSDAGVVSNADDLIRPRAHQNVWKFLVLLLIFGVVVDDIDDVHAGGGNCGIGIFGSG